MELNILNYDDKSGEDELERSKLVGGKGVFVHKYRRLIVICLIMIMCLKLR